jgi:hypothetical protein
MQRPGAARQTGRDVLHDALSALGVALAATVVYAIVLLGGRY